MPVPNVLKCLIQRVISLQILRNTTSINQCFIKPNVTSDTLLISSFAFNKIKASQAMILLLISCMTVSSLGFGQGPNYIPPVNSDPNRKCNIEGQACGAPPAFRALGRTGGASLPCCTGEITQIPQCCQKFHVNS